MSEARLRRCVPRGSYFIIFIMLSGGCDRGEAPQVTPAIRDLPVEMTIKQRSTTAVPGSDKLLRVTIDDITAGQVMVSVADKEGRGVLAATSLKQGEGARFTFREEEFRLTLKELENELIGEDYATVVIEAGGTSSSPRRVPSNPALPARGRESEAERIERLLTAIESAEGVVFIRNGIEHSPQDAAAHLRTKWSAAGGEVATAEDFIDKIASKSSFSGEPYRVRLADGTEVLAGDYLRGKLIAIEDATK